MKKIALFCLIFLCAGSLLRAQEYHVSVKGDDAGNGSAANPFRTIMAAANAAQPGDTITVHEGVYRERINPPRGGTSDRDRIVYRAAKGQKVVIKGSEPIKGWEKVQGDTWKVMIPSSFFGAFNPYNDLIGGDWFHDKGRNHHTGVVYLNGHWLIEAASLEPVLEPAGDNAFWFAQVDQAHTTIWAQFKGVNPNEADVEINVRQSVFYPDKTGINYITVRGFTMMHAATPWAPPTVEQIGLIGTNWSKGWIIEDNHISYSTCVGITLGKYGGPPNPPIESAEDFVKYTVEPAFDHGWHKDTVGHHMIRNNHISHCEQAGIVGSLGCTFSTITGNVIHDIHIRGLFSGFEMAGIKFHAPIDTLISKNHIYRCCRGIWLDWMTQGTRVTGNLMHDNGLEDLFVEVNHGPFVVDNNIFLSRTPLRDWSQGGAYVHNLFRGEMKRNRVLNRSTPFHKAHSTEIAGIENIKGGDNRFYYNVFIGSSLAIYDEAAFPVTMVGNVFLNGAKPSVHEKSPVLQSDYDPKLEYTQEGETVSLSLTLNPTVHDLCTRNGLIDETYMQSNIVTTKMLGQAKITGLSFLNSDGTELRLDTDYLGRARDETYPSAGPFEKLSDSNLSVKVWQKPRTVN